MKLYFIMLTIYTEQYQRNYVKLHSSMRYGPLKRILFKSIMVSITLLVHLTWDDENYYLIAFDQKDSKIKHYRVDKMIHMDLIKEERLGREHFYKL